jgi:hypothetical protein
MYLIIIITDGIPLNVTPLVRITYNLDSNWSTLGAVIMNGTVFVARESNVYSLSNEY